MPALVLEREQTQTTVITHRNDKRYFPRWEVRKKVECMQPGWRTDACCTKDLSLNGVSVCVIGNAPDHCLVQLRIHLQDNDAFETRGRIVWSSEGSAHMQYGIVFEDLSTQAQETILRHAFEPEANGLCYNG